MALNPRQMLGLGSNRPTMQFQQLNQAFQSDPRRILGQTLMGQGASAAPVATPLQGLGRLSSALVGAYLQRKASDDLAAREQDARSALLASLPANVSPAIRGAVDTNPAGLQQAMLTSALAPTSALKTQELPGAPGAVVVGTETTGPFGKTQFTPSSVYKPSNTQTSAQKNAAALGLVQGTPEYNEFIRQAALPKPDTTAINVDTGRQFTPEQQEVGKRAAQRIDKNYFEPSAKADEIISNVNQALSILENAPDLTGLGAEGLLALQSTVGGIVNAFGVDPEALGIDVEKITNQQILRSTINKLVLDQTSKLKGALSDRELAFSGEATAQLGTTVEANKVILAFQKQAAIKTQLMANEASRYFGENGTYGPGKIGDKSYASVDQYLSEYKNDNEVFGPALINRFTTESEIKAYQRLRGDKLTELETQAMIDRINFIRQN